MARARREARTPALGGSLALHAGVLLTGWLLLRHAAPPLQPLTEPVAVTVVSSAPPGLASPAVQAPEPAPAQAPEPAEAPAPPAETERPAPPHASPPPPPPAPAPPRASPPPTPKPRPTPPEPAPRSQPRPAPKPEPAPKPLPKPAPKAAPRPDLNLDALASSLPKTKAKPKPQRDLDLSALASSLPRDRAAKAGAGALDLAALADSLPAGSRHAAGVKGAARPETAREARTTAGASNASMTANELGAISDGLNRHFNKNWCVLDGARTIAVSVRMQLDAQGQLAAAPQVLSATGEASQQLKDVVAERAITAARLAAPFHGVTRPLDVRIKLSGKVLCNG